MNLKKKKNKKKSEINPSCALYHVWHCTRGVVRATCVHQIVGGGDVFCFFVFQLRFYRCNDLFLYSLPARLQLNQINMKVHEAFIAVRRCTRTIRSDTRTIRREKRTKKKWEKEKNVQMHMRSNEF